MSRTASQREADARYEIKRPGENISFRVTDEQASRLESMRQPGESRPQMIRRVLGL